jgi:hypothetical protein
MKWPATASLGGQGSVMAVVSTGYYAINSGAWAKIGNAPYSVNSLSGGASATGDRTSLTMGGGYSFSTNFYLYDGSSWAAGSSLGQDHRYSACAGTYSDRLTCYDGTSTSQTSSDKWNGTSHSSAISVGAYGGGAMVGSGVNAVIAVGGNYTSTYYSVAKTYNGTSWTNITAYPLGAIGGSCGFGTVSDAYFHGGVNPGWSGSDSYSWTTDLCYNWNGSSWSASDAINEHRTWHGGNSQTTGWVTCGARGNVGSAGYTYIGTTQYWVSDLTITCLTESLLTGPDAAYVYPIASKPYIASVVPSTFGDAQTGIVITTQYITTTGAKVYINGVEQTVTGTTANSITFTSVRGASVDGDYLLLVVNGP